ncbi:uncharacterized protein PGTG_04133 [Puccinia graminis f. sp. tritici CRL 75-36-700-3]|uniref:Uncharacterized protein n=1 Tax=Puccinia graminis f. sp. tritici (strain CRL 75-36-700-3 / race SCCL) TaxID=418459 RepID=E3K1K2_PUCGT|nr:uncharacterized protein PGTG_04133 [Puccinia graminis f. sp. tritici CRL 75-36-700-3]EFP78177.2 hypothetical protein PGTG_04133 [Puccinia graminis f. sp. tritici CRL 75-36-700-3]
MPTHCPPGRHGQEGLAGLGEVGLPVRTLDGLASRCSGGVPIKIPVLASLQNFTEVTPNSEAAYSLELNALLAHDRQFAFENQGLYRNRAGRNGMATFRGPTKPLPHPKVAALRRRGKRDGRRKNRTPPSGVGTPPRPRGGAQGFLGRRGRDAADDADQNARPTNRMRLA